MAKIASGMDTQSGYVINFSNALYDAKIPNYSSFMDEGKSFVIPIKNMGLYETIDEPIATLLNVTGIPGTASSAPSEAETHEISGYTTKDAKLIFLDTTTSELIKAENVAMGNYVVDVPDRIYDVVAKTIEDGEAIAWTGVQPIEKIV